MKIAKLEAHVVQEGWRNLVLVKVLTDEGLSGIGEAYSCGPDLATIEVVRDFESWLVGEDPRNIEHLWQKLYIDSRFPGGSVTMAAISGIEHGLWDIQGKALGVPVWQLLGGRCRDRIRVYQGIGGSTPSECADQAVRLIERYGYTAVKMSPYGPRGFELPENANLREAEKRIEAVRRAVGEDVDIGVDAHARIIEPVRVVQLARVLEPYRPMFLEEPLRPENIPALAEAKREMRIPLATGEMLYTKYQFHELLRHRAADIIQPDLCIAGGLLECRKIAAMAEADYVTVAPHNPMGPLATVVNVHYAASIPNFFILEYIPDDQGPRSEFLRQPLKVEKGYLPLPTGPGLGVELNEEVFAKHPYRPWHRSFAKRHDGGVAFI
ncbi:MAG: galactonate dehydratase [Planctomycetes bacterium]|nr:galactonate dehydratase [Planctomycetota bacterium]